MLTTKEYERSLKILKKLGRGDSFRANDFAHIFVNNFTYDVTLFSEGMWGALVKKETFMFPSAEKALIACVKWEESLLKSIVA